MMNRLKLILLAAAIAVSATALAQSEPEPVPSAEPAPAATVAPETPTSPTVPAAKAGAPALPAKPATPAKPEAPKPSAPPRYYRLDFVFKEAEEAKVTNSRAYSAIVLGNVAEGDSRGSIRAGNRVPVATGSYSVAGQSGNSVLPVMNTQFQYIDVGVNIDVWHIRELDGELCFVVAAEISSLGPKTDINQSIVRQNRWNSEVRIPMGKPVVIYSSDDLGSTRTMQLEVKATPITTK